MEKFLERYETLLSVITSIPPIGPSASLLINYLLRYTNEITDGIIGYDVSSLSAEAESSTSADTTLKYVVRSLSLLDKSWASILRGQMVDLKIARQHIQQENEIDTGLFPFESTHNHPSAIDEATTGRYPPIESVSSSKEATSILGSRGFATVGQTHRIRLRNIITLAKENLFSWMRTQLDAPLPPMMEEESSRYEQSEQKGDDPHSADTMADNTDFPEEADLEHTSLPQEEPESNDHRADSEIDLQQTKTKIDEMQGPTSAHYDELFARKLDPDADDDDDDDENNTLQKRKASESNTPPSHAKHRRTDNGADQRSSWTASETADAESAATLMATGAPTSASSTVLQWDVAFAHLFRQTLRSLSDIQEYNDTRRPTQEE